MKPTLFVLLLNLAAALAAGQAQPSVRPTPPTNDPAQAEAIRTIDEMLTKRRIEQSRKEYQEMLAQGDEALSLAAELQKTVEEKGSLAAGDAKKLQKLEELVKEIRDDLGGDGDESDEKPTEARKPSGIKESFALLRSSTEKLVEELKKGSRFTVSVVAIETSNAVIRVARFLRLAK